MSNAIACINKRFAVKNSGHESGVSYLALIFNLSNPRLREKNQFKVAKYDFSYTSFSMDLYELMA